MSPIVNSVSAISASALGFERGSNYGVVAYGTQDGGATMPVPAEARAGDILLYVAASSGTGLDAPSGFIDIGLTGNSYSFAAKTLTNSVPSTITLSPGALASKMHALLVVRGVKDIENSNNYSDASSSQSTSSADTDSLTEGLVNDSWPGILFVMLIGDGNPKLPSAWPESLTKEVFFANSNTSVAVFSNKYLSNARYDSQLITYPGGTSYDLVTCSLLIRYQNY